MRRIRGGFLSGGNHFAPANVHGVLARKLPRYFLQRFFHAFAVFGPRKIEERLIHKFRSVRFRLSSGHVSSPNRAILLRRLPGSQGEEGDGERNSPLQKGVGIPPHSWGFGWM